MYCLPVAVERSMFLRVLMTNMYLLLMNEAMLFASVTARLLLRRLAEYHPGCADLQHAKRVHIVLSSLHLLQ